jgi:hypothetical protein
MRVSILVPLRSYFALGLLSWFYECDILAVLWVFEYFDSEFVCIIRLRKGKDFYQSEDTNSQIGRSRHRKKSLSFRNLGKGHLISHHGRFRF